MAAAFDRAGGISVHVTPGAKRDAVEITSAGIVKVKLRARAVDGKANAALCDFVAEFLGRPRSTVTIRFGELSRQKVVCVSGMSAAEILQKLSARSRR